MLLTVVVHLRRQPGAAEASEAQRHGQRRAALFGSARCALFGSGRRDLVGSGRGGGGICSLTLLRLQRMQHLAHLLGARSQLGEQRSEAEIGISQPQSTDGLQEAVGHATSSRRPALSASRSQWRLGLNYETHRAPRGSPLRLLYRAHLRIVGTAAGVDHGLGEAVRWVEARVEGYAVRQLSDRD
eukprot:scaffold34343_cov74-Phaeocystis_antarctica.AAC.6